MWTNLIAVTDSATCPRALEDQLDRICNHAYKPQAIILRAKELPLEKYTLLAQKALKLAQGYKMPLILHSHWQLALELGVTALQLPLPLLRTEEFQQHKASFTELFTSIHSRQELAEAASLGATAVIAGHIYTTQCKADLQPRGLVFLEEICQAAKAYALPVYAIGGIKFADAQLEAIKNTGAAGACIMSGYMQL